MRQGRVKKVNITVYEHETVKRLRSDNADWSTAPTESQPDVGRSCECVLLHP